MPKTPPATTTLPLPWEEPLKLTFLPTRRHAGANSAVLELHPAAPFAHLTSDFSGDCLSYRPNTGQEYEAKVLHAATGMEFSLQAAPTPKARSSLNSEQKAENLLLAGKNFRLRIN